MTSKHSEQQQHVGEMTTHPQRVWERWVHGELAQAQEVHGAPWMKQQVDASQQELVDAEQDEEEGDRLIAVVDVGALGGTIRRRPCRLFPV